MTEKKDGWAIPGDIREHPTEKLVAYASGGRRWESEEMPLGTFSGMLPPRASEARSEEGAVLDAVRLRAFERLLEMSARLVELGRHRPDSEPLQALAHELGESACLLAGMTSEGEVAAGDRLVFAVELERPTTVLWNARVLAPSEKAVMHYLDGPSRAVAVAHGLVLLARTVLDRDEDIAARQLELASGCREGRTTPESVLSDALGQAMDDYEENLCSVYEATEQSYHGDGGVD